MSAKGIIEVMASLHRATPGHWEPGAAILNPDDIAAACACVNFMRAHVAGMRDAVDLLDEVAPEHPLTRKLREVLDDGLPREAMEY